MFLVVKTNGDAAEAATSIRAAVRTVDPSQPFADVFTMRQRLERSLSRARTSLMLAEGMTLTCIGATAGVIGAAIVASAIQSALYGTSPMDARQYLLGITCVLLCSVVALWLPARRASAADPLVALRGE